MGDGDTLVNVLIGAAINVFGGPILPFATVIGGAVAGYLHAGSREAGLKVGALAGLVSLVPLLIIGAVLGNVFLGLFLGGFGVPRAFSGFGVVIIIGIVVSALVYTVVLSAVGGWLGNYVRYDTDIDI
ncbi:DUF5518 domain-containing protein [Salinibaculum rarum]|uniref:DUF5518 domain-containing protein n=1 Tax=Salinibaculum rarum TaxID=3058903 RepID=UPI00265ED1DE|nr:DUF5518 domain-containing protein [Salinibaculum sp. KK48]